ncbi:MAG: Uma2 family endonuclease [bacterium]|nr:Uma2 family endonuclease [Myxococcales bacterium]MCB9542966.1 Uma2 family endonuclease [Myxococcales bacterium]MCB9551539.1 Uma2 family endonuclease [Myxococcales bacterium]
MNAAAHPIEDDDPPPPSRPALYHVTEEEFLELPESTDRVELIDGEIYVAPSGTWRHQSLALDLAIHLRGWAATRDPRPAIGIAPCDVRFGPDRILQPDLFVILGGLPPDAATPLRTVPDLCVEILSQNRAYDRLAKRFIYAQAGVAELWTVDPAGHLERWSGPGLAARELVAGTLTTPLLPGLSIALPALFRGGLG